MAEVFKSFLPRKKKKILFVSHGKVETKKWFSLEIPTGKE